MAIYRKYLFRGGIKMLLLLTLLYGLTTIGYYYLPWSVRKHVAAHLPKLDRGLCRRGYQLLLNWDELALVGNDVKVPCKNSAAKEYFYGGQPVSTEGPRAFEILPNKGYVVGYSEKLRNPLWACYRIFDVQELKSEERPSHFSTDTRTWTKVNHNDYTNSGFDRGHMAPNFGIATRYGREAQLETFKMSNIIPQTPSINRHLWKDLELRVAEKYGRYFTEVWVITGPVFDEEYERLESGIPIPSAYYKIILDERYGNLRALAFLIPQQTRPYARIRDFLVSIDEIEEKTHLDFFPDLPDDVETPLEEGKATRLWHWIAPSVSYSWLHQTD